MTRTRYGELRRKMPDISEKMLTQRLRELEREGLVERATGGGPIPIEPVRPGE